MERRKFKRITDGHKAEIIYDGKSYEGVIDDLSEKGIGIITIKTDKPIDFLPGAAIELKFQPLPGKSLNMHCNVKWYKTILPHALTIKIGLEIIDPPWDESEYFL